MAGCLVWRLAIGQVHHDRCRAFGVRVGRGPLPHRVCRRGRNRRHGFRFSTIHTKHSIRGGSGGGRVRSAHALCISHLARDSPPAHLNGRSTHYTEQARFCSQSPSSQPAMQETPHPRGGLIPAYVAGQMTEGTASRAILLHPSRAAKPTAPPPPNCCKPAWFKYKTIRSVKTLHYVVLASGKASYQLGRLTTLHIKKGSDAVVFAAGRQGGQTSHRPTGWVRICQCLGGGGVGVDQVPHMGHVVTQLVR